MWLKSIRLLMTASLLFSYFVQAESIGKSEKIAIHGFGTLGATQVGNDDLGFRNDIGQEGQFGGWQLRTVSVLGVQADYSISDKLSFNSQLIVKDRIRHDVSSYIERAHLTYNFNPSWILRLGRISNDASLISEFGSVGYAYDWAHSPNEYYGFFPLYYFDGGDITYKAFFNRGTLATKLFVGQANDLTLSAAGDRSFNLEPYIATSIRYDENRFSLRGSFAQAPIAHYSTSDLQLLAESLTRYGRSDLSEQLDINDRIFRYYTLGFEYRTSGWKSVSELAYMDSSSELVLPYLSGYSSAFYRFSDWGVYMVGSFIHATQSPNHVAESFPYSEPLNRLYSATQSNQKTLSLGSRWDVATGVSLKFQWDHSWVEKNGSFLWDSHMFEQTSRSRELDGYTLAVNFIF